MKDGKLIFRALYQHVRTQGNLPHLKPRPLLAQEVQAGTSEFAISGVRTDPGGGLSLGGLIVRRTYSGYVAVHYPVTTNPGDITPDEAALNAALEGFRLIPAVQVAGFINFGGFDTNFRLNEFPEKAGQPPVLSMFTDFDLTLDLETGVTYT